MSKHEKDLDLYRPNGMLKTNVYKIVGDRFRVIITNEGDTPITIASGIYDNEVIKPNQSINELHDGCGIVSTGSKL